MLQQFEDDLTSIYEEQVFTETFTHTYTGGGGGTEDVEAYFDEEYVELLSQIESSSPAITIMQTDMTNVADDSTFTRQADSTVYKIKSIRPEDNGLRLILLTKDSK